MMVPPLYHFPVDQTTYNSKFCQGDSLVFDDLHLIDRSMMLNTKNLCFDHKN